MPLHANNADAVTLIWPEPLNLRLCSHWHILSRLCGLGRALQELIMQLFHLWLAASDSCSAQTGMGAPKESAR